MEPALRVHFSIGLLLLNALPVMLGLFVIYALSGRALFSLWVGGTIALVLYIVSAIKLQNMNAPLMPGDAVLIGQLFRNLDLFSQYAGSIALLVIGLLAFIAICWLLWRMERQGARGWRVRVPVLVVALALNYCVYQGVEPWAAAYGNNRVVKFALWDPATSVQRNGLMLGMVRLTQEKKVEVPKSDKGLVDAFVQQHEGLIKTRMNRTLPTELPDIVIVQSEAFFEPGIMNKVQDGQYDPNFERLAATGITGELGTPAYGGGTIRTEFEVLSGYPMMAFPSVSYPYYGLAQHWMPTVPQRLRKFGYQTTLYHPFKGSFWNRNTVMPSIGFEATHFLPDFKHAPRAGAHVSDRALFGRVLNYLQHAGSSPQLVMAITMENHGPWANEVSGLDHPVTKADLPAGLSGKGLMEMRYYISHLENGDQALGDFAAKLMQRKRWTVLLFYGDHLPALSHAFRQLGFDNGKTHGFQHTRYMIVSNRPMPSRKLDLHAFEVPSLLFDTIGLPEDGYLAIDGAVREASGGQYVKKGSHLDKVAFNAARMEVSCKHRINAEQGDCSKSVQ
ncbi:hypothetical protein BTJ49_05655 [Oleiagrimonas sp. MCCC 1A03011]|nr:hypothetical protein BTJ49_05655 [Oleiagrimonas sp. MCCC 1A03011]